MGRQKSRNAPSAFVYASVLLWTGPLHASLNLQLVPAPDVSAFFIDVAYDSSSDSFLASGFAFQLDDDQSIPAETILGGTFDLSAAIDSAGALMGGSLAIGGTVPPLGFNSGTLLTGTLVDFGFPAAGGDPLEFVFHVTGGDAAGLFGSVPAGLILSGGTGFGGSFAVDFRGSGSAFADAAPIVPLPGSLWLALAGLAPIAARRTLKKF